MKLKKVFGESEVLCTNEILNDPHFAKCFNGNLSNNRDFIEYLLSSNMGTICFIVGNHVDLVRTFKLLDKFFYKSNIKRKLRYVDGKKLKRLARIKEADILAFDMFSFKPDMVFEKMINDLISKEVYCLIFLYGIDQSINLKTLVKPKYFRLHI